MYTYPCVLALAKSYKLFQCRRVSTMSAHSIYQCLYLGAVATPYETYVYIQGKYQFLKFSVLSFEVDLLFLFMWIDFFIA